MSLWRRIFGLRKRRVVEHKPNDEVTKAVVRKELEKAQNRLRYLTATADVEGRRG